MVISFDEEYAASTGMPVKKLNLLLLCMVALTVVVLIRVVGMILVIALLAFPAALARQFTSNLKSMMLCSILFGAAFTFGGLWLSYELGLASGATIILLGGLALLITLAVRRLRRKAVDG
jgi:zinc transport system permease protein